LKVRVNQLETIIFKLATKKKLEEKQEKVIKKIIKKRGGSNSNKGNQ